MARTAEKFTSVQAAKIVGLPYRTLDHWARTSVIIPSVSEAKGTGTERSYSFTDLVALCVARELRKAGISLQTLRCIVNRLLTEDDEQSPLSGARFFIVGSDVVMAKNCKQVFSVLKKPGQGVFAFMLDLDKTVSELRHRVKDARAA